MKHCVLRTGAIVIGLVLVVPLGCQTESKHATPGALPTAVGQDVTPRLNASTYFAYAHLLERQGNLEQAVGQYRQALALSPDFVSAHNRLGVVLNKLGRHAEASDEFRAAIRQTPTEAYLYNNLGFSLYLEGHYADAAEALARAVELKPEFKRARMNFGIVLAKLERYNEALTQFTLASDAADANYNLGVIYTEAGEFAAAARCLMTALQMNPDFAAARDQLHVVAALAAQAENKPPTAVPTKPQGAADASHVEEVPAVPPSVPVAPAPVEVAAAPTDDGVALAAWTDETSEIRGSIDTRTPEDECPAAPFDWDAFAANFDQGAVGPVLDQLVTAAARNLRGVCDLILDELDGYLATVRDGSTVTQ